MSGLRIITPAKINLGLFVLNKRSDGYHNIETILIPINLFDEIFLFPIKKSEIIVKVLKERIKKEDNLVFKAAKIFLENFKIKKGVKIIIKKNIPIGKGLGGGSSDAGATLYGLNLLFNRIAQKEELYKLATAIGMDVPFFIDPKPAFAYQRGEVLERIVIPKLYFLLHLPKERISTRWAYEQVKLTKHDFSLKILIPLLRKNLYDKALIYLKNDFQDLICKRYKRIRMVIKKMEDLNLKPLLTGTGSGIYVWVRNKKEQERIKRLLKEKGITVLKVESFLGRRLMGRTQDFGSCCGGSNPPAPAIF
jgi:4-diphosphocytidyl-2-C-methyl-D-erythritol kinase